MPLTNTAVIPSNWSRHHQPAAESAMRTTVDILLPVSDLEPPGWGEEPSEVGDVLIADVPSRVRALSDDTAVAASGQQVDSQAYLIQTASDLMPDIRVGKGNTAHRFRVTSNPNSPGLEGQVMQILAVQHGSESFNRDWFCQVHVNQQQG